MPTTATARSLSQLLSRSCARRSSFVSIQRDLRADDAELLARHAASRISATSLPISPTPPRCWRWSISSSASTPRSPMSPARSAGRRSCCCRSSRTGAGRSIAIAAPGIRARPVPAAGDRRLGKRDGASGKRARRTFRWRLSPYAATRIASGRRRQRMALEPVARGALSATDLAVAHLLGDLAAQARGILMPAHGGDVEPLVRLDQIDRDPRPRRIDHRQPEAVFGAGRLARGVRNFQVNFHVGFACQPFRPPVLIATGCEAPAPPIASSLLPGARMAPRTGTIFGRKFE